MGKWCWKNQSAIGKYSRECHPNVSIGWPGAHARTDTIVISDGFEGLRSEPLEGKGVRVRKKKGKRWNLEGKSMRSENGFQVVPSLLHIRIPSPGYPVALLPGSRVREKLGGFLMCSFMGDVT